MTPNRARLHNMTTEGDSYDCDVCGGTHTVKRDDGGFPAALGFTEYYVVCPEYGEITWTE